MYNFGGLKDGGRYCTWSWLDSSFLDLPSGITAGGSLLAQLRAGRADPDALQGVFRAHTGGVRCEHRCPAPLRSSSAPPVSPGVPCMPILLGRGSQGSLGIAAQPKLPGLALPGIPSAPQLQPGHRGCRTLVQEAWVWLRMGVRNRSRGRKCVPK